MFKRRKDYNEAELRATLKKLTIEEVTGPERSTIITKFDDRTLYSADVSHKYGIFKFGEFLQELLTPLKQYFIAETYDLLIYGAVQELRLYSGLISLNDSNFKRVVSIISSSDGSISLQMNVGLSNTTATRSAYRYFFVGDDERISIRCKHFKNSVKEHTIRFTEALPFLGVIFDNQEKLLEAISSTKISLKEFGKRIAYKEDGKVRSSIFKSFEKVFYLIKNELRRKDEDIGYISAETFIKSDKDIEYNSYDLLDKYSSLFQGKNSATILKETQRAYGVIKDIKKDYTPVPKVEYIKYNHTNKRVSNPTTNVSCPVVFDSNTFTILESNLKAIGVFNTKNAIELEIVENGHKKVFQFNTKRTDWNTNKKSWLYSNQTHRLLIEINDDK